MGDINDLRRARKAAADDMQASADALTALEDQDGAEATALATAQAAFDAAKAAFEKADRQVKRAEEVEASRAAAAQPEPGAGDEGQQGAAPAQVKEKGLKFGAMPGVRTVLSAQHSDEDQQQRFPDDTGFRHTKLIEMALSRPPVWTT